MMSYCHEPYRLLQLSRCRILRRSLILAECFMLGQAMWDDIKSYGTIDIKIYRIYKISVAPSSSGGASFGPKNLRAET